MTGTMTVDTQDVWPPRRLITVTGLTNAFFTLYRVVGGNREPLRGVIDNYIYPATTWLAVDAEFPFGVPVSYQLEEGGAIVDTFGPETIDLPGGLVALTDAISGLSAEVIIGAVDEMARTTRSTVYEIDGLNRVVGSPQAQAQTTVEYFTQTLTARNNLQDLLANATANTIQQRAAIPSYDVDTYYAILGSRERRFSQDGSDPRRVTAVTVAQVSGWPAGLRASGYTYQDVADAYTGLTYADLAGDFATYLELAQGDFG